MSLPVVLLVASTAISAMGSIAQGKAASASYKAQSQAQTYNSIVDKNNADQVATEYAVKENNLRQQQAGFLGRQRAALAESGIGPGGSAGDVISEDTTRARMDDLTLRYEGQTKRTAYLNNSTLDKYQSKVASMNAGAASQAGYMGALGAVIGGAGRYSDYTNRTQLFTS
jgi:hypothetical protein